MKVRGAPAIGLAAAYGVCLGLQSVRESDQAAFRTRLEEVTGYLASSRPTAVNLFWALERMKQVVEEARGANSSALLHEALLPRPGRSTTRTGRRVTPSGGMAPSCCRTGPGS